MMHNEPEPNRTIFLGGVTAGITAHDVCNAVRGGLVEDVHMLPEKKCAFVSFVSPQSAAMFHSMNANGLEVNGVQLKVGRGKPRRLSRAVCAALEQGLTRNVFLGGTDDSVTIASLKADLGRFGEIEKCDVLPAKHIAFVHFTSMTAALECVMELKAPQSQLHSKGYNKFRVNYGRDRCDGRP